MIPGGGITNSSDKAGDSSGDGHESKKKENNEEEELVSVDTIRALIVYYAIERETKCILFGASYGKVKQLQDLLDLLKLALTKSGFNANFTKEEFQGIKEAARWRTHFS